MTVTKAQIKAVNKYMKENYDRVNLTLPKGTKEQIKAAADQKSQSVNAWIAEAIAEKMHRDGAAEGDG